MDKYELVPKEEDDMLLLLSYLMVLDTDNMGQYNWIATGKVIDNHLKHISFSAISKNGIKIFINYN